MRPRDAVERQELEDLGAGRAVIYLSDGETWSGLAGAKVVIYRESDHWEDGYPPQGYSEIGLDVLVRHFLQTKP